MPAAPTKYPYLSWKFNKIVLRFPIPKAQQTILGRPMFRLVMAQTDMAAAHTASLPILAEWRRQIAEAKATATDHLAAEVMSLRIGYEKATGETMTTEEFAWWERMYAYLATRGGVGEVERRAIRAEAKNELNRALLAIPQAPQTLALIDGTAKVAPPFLAHLAAWKERTHLKGKYLDQAVSAIEAFAKAVPCSLETLTGAMVQGWIEHLLKPINGSKSLLPATVQRLLKGPRSYWEWMALNGKVDSDRHPFNDRAVRDHRTAYEVMEAEVQAFDVADVPRLWAEAGDDTDLVAIIRIGGFTGMRREEICSLSVDQVRDHGGIRYLHEVGRKTRSAIRAVPIPAAIEGLIDDLCAHATADGYLIHDGTLDKYGHRGATVGKRFSALKTRMGFKARVQVFNSLRHTAIKAMKEQKIVVDPFLLSIVKNIVGHKDQDITSGRYAGVSGLADKLRVMETIQF